MDQPDKTTELMLGELLADLSPEELEPRLELQVFLDPISLAAECNNNNKGTNIVWSPDCNNNNN